MKWFEKIKLRNLLWEMFSIVFAVSLALFLNEWRGEIQKENQLISAREKIKNEIRENIKEIQSTLKMHKAQLKALEDSKEEIEGSTKRFYEYDFGVAVLNLKDDNWETIKLTQIVNEFSFEELSGLSELYRSKETIDKLQDNLLTTIFSLEFNDPQKSQQVYFSLHSYLIQIIAWEQEILRGLEEYAEA